MEDGCRLNADYAFFLSHWNMAQGTLFSVGGPGTLENTKEHLRVCEY